MRKSVLTTSLSATLGERAVIVPATPEEILIRETEEKMVNGVRADEGEWMGVIGHYSGIKFIEHKDPQRHPADSYSLAQAMAYVQCGLVPIRNRERLWAFADIEAVPARYSRLRARGVLHDLVYTSSGAVSMEYAAADAVLTDTLFYIDSLGAMPSDSDEPEEQPRCPHPDHQRRPGRQSPGPLRPGAVLQAARRRDGWLGRK